ncbi:T9SS type A sorting domain-containing protein [Salibacter sp.]|uniref:T9SS type A sorting domain-containing protein n=1 Tax=Salibacter sp. TaxID=2010995 RepID=UPI0028702847|nr:T9SS type A sorting domain-containing protein [Salibacter sp.]MDR9486673.1 T9SS type A sorting domain-containing protein [Salibacter sp.]
MDRLLIIFFSLLISTTCLKAQVEHVFSKDFDHNGRINSSSNVEEISPGQYVFSQWISTQNYRDLELVKINEQGDSITSTKVQYNNQRLYDGRAGSLAFTSNSKLAYLYDPSQDSIAILSFYTTLLDHTFTRVYDMGRWTATSNVAQVNDSTLILTGRVENNNDIDIFVINTDLQGNERWRKIIPNPGLFDRNAKVYSLNNKVLIGYIVEYNVADLKPGLIVLDPETGNIEHDTIYQDYSLGVDFINTGSYENDEVYFCAGKIVNNQQNTALIKLRTDDYSIEWSKEYFPEGSILPTEGYLKDGIINLTGGPFGVPPVDSTFFMKVSASNGDSLDIEWYKYNNSDRTGLLDIEATSDGGFIMAGEVSNPDQNAWIVKADPNGCISQLCLGVDDVVKQNVNVSIYPNPTRQNSTLAIDKAHLLGKDAVFTLYNSTGQEVMHFPVQGSNFQKRLRVDEPGLYFGVLTQNGEPVKTAKWIVY